MAISKTNKRIISELYRKGMSKNNIYSVMKKEGFNVKRSDVRSYLIPKMYRTHQGLNSNYNIRYNSARERMKGDEDKIKKERDRLNKNYLISAIIYLEQKKKIKTNHTINQLVKFDKITNEWMY